MFNKSNNKLIKVQKPYADSIARTEFTFQKGFKIHPSLYLKKVADTCIPAILNETSNPNHRLILNEVEDFVSEFERRIQELN